MFTLVCFTAYQPFPKYLIWNSVILINKFENRFDEQPKKEDIGIANFFFFFVEVTPPYGNAVSIFLTLTDNELQASS